MVVILVIKVAINRGGYCRHYLGKSEACLKVTDKAQNNSGEQ